jgi:hypothetical protein
VGWAGYEYYARQAAELVAQAQEEIRSESPPGQTWRQEAKLMATVESRRIERKGEPFLIIGGLGGIFAGVILLWNIIWHTAHWIWMGRKVV